MMSNPSDWLENGKWINRDKLTPFVADIAARHPGLFPSRFVDGIWQVFVPSFPVGVAADGNTLKVGGWPVIPPEPPIDGEFTE